jgi:hypothetical protein
LGYTNSIAESIVGGLIDYLGRLDTASIIAVVHLCRLMLYGWHTVAMLYAAEALVCVLFVLLQTVCRACVQVTLSKRLGLTAMQNSGVMQLLWCAMLCAAPLLFALCSAEASSYGQSRICFCCGVSVLLMAVFG